MEKVHHHAEGIYKVDLGEEPKKTDNSFSTTTDNYKDNSNKNKMVNNGDSDDNNRNEENKNNTQNIILAQSQDQYPWFGQSYSAIIANINQVFAKKLMHSYKNSKEYQIFLVLIT